MSREYRQVDTRPTFVFSAMLEFSHEARLAGLTVAQQRCLRFCVEWIKEMRPWINDIFLNFDQFPMPQFPIQNMNQLYASGLVNDAMIEILKNEGRLTTMYTKIIVGVSYCDSDESADHEDIYSTLIDYLLDENDCRLFFDIGNHEDMHIMSDLDYDETADWDAYFYS